MRIETGVVQAHEDWPGIFIRGDDSFAFYLALDHAVKMITKLDLPNDNQTRYITLPMMQSLRDLLQACNTNEPTFNEEQVQQITLCNNDFK